MEKKKKEKKKGRGGWGVGGGVDLGKERLSVPNIPGDEWENQGSPRKTNKQKND